MSNLLKHQKIVVEVNYNYTSNYLVHLGVGWDAQFEVCVVVQEERVVEHLNLVLEKTPTSLDLAVALVLVLALGLSGLA